MTAIEHLRSRRGTTPADVLAKMTRQPIEDVYAQLVAAESAGVARIAVRYRGHIVVSREWAYVQGKA